jgi:hypothetical protein
MAWFLDRMRGEIGRTLLKSPDDRSTDVPPDK